MSSRDYWDRIYRSTAPSDVSWYQNEASVSLDLVKGVTPERESPIIDVGGGASVFVDGLLDAAYGDVTVLDLAQPALEAAQGRLGARASQVSWVEADVLVASLPADHYAVWHDRAVFHFLTQAADRIRYVEQVRRALRPGGHIILASFALDGPARCSGLDVIRYSPEGIHAEFGDRFRLVSSRREEHRTPSGTMQGFVYTVLQLAAGVRSAGDGAE